MVAVVITAGIIYASEFKNLRESFVSKLGDFSYGVYLLHVPIGIYFVGAFKELIIKENLFIRICIDISLYIIILIFSKYLYSWIEKPAVVLGNKVTKKLFSDSGNSRYTL